jgi:hypothetical protein
MRKLFIPIALVIVLLLATFGILQVARGQILPGQNNEAVINTESQNDNTRQITAPEGDQAVASGVDQPLISFIDSPTAACVQPDMTKDECYINWYYMSVSASPANYIISMTVTLNEFGFVSYNSGFFQTSMYVPFNMNPQGYKVACGALGDGGNPQLGKAYAWTIRARETGGLRSANYGTVYCPAYTP